MPPERTRSRRRRPTTAGEPGRTGRQRRLPPTWVRTAPCSGLSTRRTHGGKGATCGSRGCPPPRGLVVASGNRGGVRVERSAPRAYRRAVPIKGGSKMATILVGTDTSAAADLAVQGAARLARDRGAELLVLYVRSRHRPPHGGRPRPRRRSRRLPGQDAGEVPRRLDADTGRGRRRRRADLRGGGRGAAETIVIGNRGAHGSRWRVRDSVPNIVLRHSPCSVFIVDTRRAQ